MKISQILAAALLGLAFGHPALAQTTPRTPAGAVARPGSLKEPNGIIGTIPPGAVPTNATTPTDAEGVIYPNGVPARSLTGGTQRADQPAVGRGIRLPAVTGSQQPYRIHKGRPSSKSTNR
jgi:hypothetical protein